MKTTTRNKINNINTLKDFLNCLQIDFKAKECKPGYLSKSTLIYYIADLCKRNDVNINNFEALKTKCLNSDNIYDFIEILKDEIKENFNFSDNAKKDLYNYILKIKTFINLQEI